MAIPVSVIVLTKNEEKNIASCLDDLKDFQEVFVVDSNSTDKTVAIAKKYKNVKIVKYKWNGKYPKKKQWSLDNIKSKTDWILLVDADEVFNDKLNDEISKAIKTKTDAFYLTGNVWFVDKKLKHGRKHSKIILFRKDCAEFPIVNDLHVENPQEIELHYQPNIKGTIGSLKNRYDHYDKKPLSALIERHEHYSSWQALVQKDIYGTGLRGFMKKVYLNCPFMPMIAFADSYILKLGFLDGKTGFNYAKFRHWYYAETQRKRKGL